MLRVFVFGVSMLFASIAAAHAATDAPPPADNPSLEQVPADVAQWFTSTMDKVLEPVTGPEAPPPATSPPADAPKKHHHKAH